MAPAGQDPPSFPGEITDAIIDYLHDDRNALRSCSLVCSGWTPSSRHHLFAIFTSSPEKCGYTDLLDFLTSTAGVTGHIHHFVLSGYRGVSLKNIVAITDALPNLRVLELDRLFVSFPSHHDPPLPPAIKGLSGLRIAACNVTDLDFDNLFRLLGLFTSVRTLRMEQSAKRHFFAHPDVSPPSVEAPYALRVTDMSLSFMPPSLIAQLVRPSRMAHWETLRSLELDECIERWEQVAHIGSILAEIGPSLRRLALKPSHRLLLNEDVGGALPAGGAGLLWGQPMGATAGGIADTRPYWEPLNLSKCTNLEVFAFDLSYGSGSPLYDVDAVFKLNVDLLSLLPGSTRCVKPRVVPVSPFQGNGLHPDGPTAACGGPLRALNWPHLDETMSHDKFKDTRVVLNVSRLKLHYATGDYETLLGFIRECLHSLRRRGALTFEVSEKAWWD